VTDSKKLEVIDGGQHQAQTQTPEPPPTNAPAQRIGGYSVPRGYEVWQNGVYRIDEIPENAITEQPALVKLPSAERRRGLRSVTRRPLWIRSLGRALDADETLLQLAYYEASNNKAPRFEWVSQLQISDRRQLVQLARSGAPVRTGNADRVEEYLDRAHVENGASLPRVLMAKRSGAYEIDDKWGWLIGSHWIGPPGIDVERDPREEPGMTKGFVVSGDEHEWFTALKKVCSVGPYARWLTFCSFAAPLLRFVRQRTFIVHHWADTSSGKSALAKFSMSAWGDPHGLTATFNRTALSFTEMFSYIDDLPIAFDELQSSKTKNHASLIYDLCLERGRARAKRSGGLHKEVESWRSVIRTTGEEPLVGKDKADLGGQLNRTLQLNVAALQERQAESIHRWLNNRCYGWGGLRFMENLCRLVNSPGGIDELQMRWSQLRTRYADEVDMGARNSAMSAIILAHALCLEWFFDTDREAAEAAALSDAVDVGKLIVADEVGKETVVDMALQIFRDHRDANRESWIDASTEVGMQVLSNKSFKRLTGVESAGADENEIWLVQSEANRLLAKAELPARRIWLDMKRRNVLNTGADGRPSQLRSLGRFRNRVYVLNAEAFNSMI
jgi:hypothetical protein|tara:strand:- start:9308 stop:11152 length:1845 start_codon:yes stop_codon:yes gene_type:complete